MVLRVSTLRASTGFQLGFNWGSTTGVQLHSKYSTTALTVRAPSSSYNTVLLHHGLDCGFKQWVYTSVATKLYCTVVLLCCAVLYCCVAVLCCAVLYCCVTVVGTVFELQHELCCTVLCCCVAVLLRCCAVLLCYCSSTLFELQHCVVTTGLIPSVVTLQW